MRKTWFKHFLTWQAERWYFLFWVLPRRFERKALPTQKVNCTDFFQFTLFWCLLKYFTASLLNGFLTVLVEEWLHRCVMTQSTPGNFLPRKITLNLKLHFSLTTSLHFTWLDCNMLLRYRTQLFELFEVDGISNPACGDRYSKIYIFGVGKWFFLVK